MPELHVERTIPVPADRVWSLLGDFPNVAKWATNLAGSRALTAQATGLGAERRCDLARSGHVRERVTRWEDGRGFDVDFLEAGAPVRDMKAGLWLEPLSPTSTRASFTLRYDPRLGPIGAALDLLMMRRMMRKNMVATLFDLERAARAVKPATQVKTGPHAGASVA